MNVFLQICIIFSLFIGFDKIWFYFSGNFVKDQIGSIMNMNNDQINVRIPAAILVYILMSIGLYYFVFALKAPNSLYVALVRGGFLGFIVFGIFDFTNRAILKHYPWEMVLVDIIWGTILFSVISGVLYYINSLKLF